MKKGALIQRTRDSRARWDLAFAALDEAQLGLPGFCGTWSAKDVIAHITWHEREMVGLIKGRALAGSELWNLPLDDRNDAIYRANVHRPAAEVRREAGAVFGELLEALETLSDDDLVDPGRFAHMPADWQPWQVIAGNTFEHYEEHMPQA